MKKIVLISTADWDTKPWTNKQHMAVELAELGFKILYIESSGIRQPGFNKKDSLRLLKRLLKGIRGIFKVKKNIWVLSPLLIPFHSKRIFKIINRFILKRILRTALNKINFNNYDCLTYNPLCLNFLDIMNPAIIIYHCVDDLSVIPGVIKEVIEKADYTLVKKCDILFVTNNELLNKWEKIKNNNIHYFPNVADYNHFAKARTTIKIPLDIENINKPIIGYIGTISDYKINFKLVIDIALMKPEWNWIFVGGEREGQKSKELEYLKSLSNVYFLGYREYTELPEYLSTFDIAVLPLNLNEYTESMFPMKFFEYLSAGCPVIATGIPALEDYTKAYKKAETAEQFIKAAEEILKNKGPENPEYCDEIAEKHTYKKRLNSMLKIINNFRLRK